MADIWRDIPFRDDHSESLGSRFWEECSLSTYRNTVEMHGPVMYRGPVGRTSSPPISSSRSPTCATWSRCSSVRIPTAKSPDFDMFAEHLRFFDRYLKGVENGIDTEDRVYYYTYNAPRARGGRAARSGPYAGCRPSAGTSTHSSTR